MGDHGAQLGLKTFIGFWYAFSGAFEEGGMTTGGGVVSCRTTSAWRRLSRAVCAGDSNRGTSLAMPKTAGGGTCWSSPHRPGVVGGVKNSLSLELSSTGPMASGHLQSHFQTDALTRITSKGAMVEGLNTNPMHRVEEKERGLAGNMEEKGKWEPYIP